MRINFPSEAITDIRNQLDEVQIVTTTETHKRSLEKRAQGDTALQKRKTKRMQTYNDPKKFPTSLMDKKSLKAAEVAIYRDLTQIDQDGNKMKYDLKFARKETGELKFLAIRKHKDWDRYPQILPRRLYKYNKRSLVTILQWKAKYCSS